MPDITVEKRSLSSIFDQQTYQLDFYQRGYQWKTQQVTDLLEDLTTQFENSYSKEPKHLMEYDNYFLGCYIVDRHRENSVFIVDGQQRLTTLTLLFIYLHNIKANTNIPLNRYVYSYDANIGSETYVFQTEERARTFKYLLSAEDSSEQIKNNLTTNYALIKKFFEHKKYSEHKIMWFVNWVTNNVKMVEIDAGSNAYNIFITMNDRGLELVADELLKGHIFSKIKQDRQAKIAELWDETVALLHNYEEKSNNRKLRTDTLKTPLSQFIIDWLTSQYAQTSKDVSAIAAFGNGKGFHKWIIENANKIDLTTSDDYENFVNKMNWYAKQYIKINKATIFSKETENVYYAHTTGLTHLRKILLSSLQFGISEEEIIQKLNWTAKIIDIWIGSWKWNGLPTEAHPTSDIALQLMILMRQNNQEQARLLIEDNTVLYPSELIIPPKGKKGVQAKKHNIRWILARLTSYVETIQNPSAHSPYEDFMNTQLYHIEHIIPASSQENFYDKEDTERELKFENTKNRLGNLILLRGKENSSLQDKPFPEKLPTYSANNKLAGMLDSRNYSDGTLTNWTSLRKLNNEKLDNFIKPYQNYGLSEIQEREKLYLKIANLIWDIKN